MRESKIEKHLRQRVKAIGGLCWKFTSPGMNGVPDRVVILPNGLLVWVELKAPGKAPRINQERRHKELWERGQRVVVIDTIEGVDKAFGAVFYE